MPDLRSRRACCSNSNGGFSLSALVLILAIFTLIAAAAYLQFRPSRTTSQTAGAILHPVAREDFLLTITERGEVRSGAVTEVRSEVKTKNTAGLAILRLVPEGTKVEEGDFLVELDSSALQEELTSQQILVNTSEALVVEAKNLYETALIAKQEYLEGTFVQERQTIESEVFVAEENLNRAQEYYEYSKKLAAKGYVNELQLEADRFAVEKSRKELEAAETKLRVLEEFTKQKMLKQLESDIVISKSKWEAEKNSHSLEVAKLEEIKDQIAKTVITAPRAGVVTYAHDEDRRGNDEFLVEEGAVVRERQTIINLPDPSSMRVDVTINESLIQFVKPGMRAEIRPVGLGDTVLRGKVAHVNQYAEPTGWRRANVKDYKAEVAIEELVEGVRSGMTASVTIICFREDDALQTPVQTVFNHGGESFTLVSEGDRWRLQPLEVGPTNDKFYVVRQGLEAGDRVAMNPQRYLDEVELPPLPAAVRPSDSPESEPATAQSSDELEADAAATDPPSEAG